MKDWPKELDLMSQEEFRKWFMEFNPVTNWKLGKIFEDFSYEKKDYKSKRLESEKETRRRIGER